jgi:hypothetical protein
VPVLLARARLSRQMHTVRSSYKTLWHASGSADMLHAAGNLMLFGGSCCR